jgi:hypothetical protein
VPSFGGTFAVDGAPGDEAGGLIADDLHWGGLLSPYIQDAIRYLSVTSSGCQWINGLYKARLGRVITEV